MSGIFISYRREDTAGHAGRVCDRLRAHFGREEVFMDLDTIPPGSDFVDAIEEAVGSCDALVVLIGREWLAAANEEGSRRLDDPEDFVRLEIAAALRRATLVIPVLVEGARMPSSRDLPDEIAKLARHNALEASDGRWDYDMDLLVKALEKVVGWSPRVDHPAPDPLVPAPPQPPAPPLTAPALAQVIPGNWNVQLHHPAVGAGQGAMLIDGSGFFQGQIMGPMGTWAVSGRWQIVGPGQLQMMGSQNNGIQVLPYQVFIQFASVTPNQLTGTTSGGETVILRRAG